MFSFLWFYSLSGMALSSLEASSEYSTGHSDTVATGVEIQLDEALLKYFQANNPELTAYGDGNGTSRFRFTEPQPAYLSWNSTGHRLQYLLAMLVALTEDTLNWLKASGLDVELTQTVDYGYRKVFWYQMTPLSKSGFVSIPSYISDQLLPGATLLTMNGRSRMLTEEPSSLSWEQYRRDEYLSLSIDSKRYTLFPGAILECPDRPRRGCCLCFGRPATDSDSEDSDNEDEPAEEERDKKDDDKKDEKSRGEGDGNDENPDNNAQKEAPSVIPVGLLANLLQILTSPDHIAIVASHISQSLGNEPLSVGLQSWAQAPEHLVTLEGTSENQWQSLLQALPELDGNMQENAQQFLAALSQQEVTSLNSAVNHALQDQPISHPPVQEEVGEGVYLDGPEPQAGEQTTDLDETIGVRYAPKDQHSPEPENQPDETDL